MHAVCCIVGTVRGEQPALKHNVADCSVLQELVVLASCSEPLARQLLCSLKGRKVKDYAQVSP